MTSLPTTVEAVLARMREIDEALPSRDGAAVFNRMYLAATEGIAAGLAGSGVFADPDFMADLDVRFACMWLKAFDAAEERRKISKAWAPLFEQRHARGVLPIQYALGGMNAHIEYDLPMAVVQTCLARHTRPSSPGVREDYEAVNDILASVEDEIRRSFLTEIGQRVDDEVGPVVHLVNSWNIDKARDLAWVSVEALWAFRTLDFLHDRYRDALAHTVGMTSRVLMGPVALALV